MIPLVILLYLLGLILILTFSKKIAVAGMNKGMDLEAIKFVVWIYLFGLIINLSICFVSFLLVYFSLISVYTFTIITIIQLISILIISGYIRKRVQA